MWNKQKKKYIMQGNLNVQTENIFPVIKKFLYSDHEIFLRELVSNAIDATQKLKALASRGELKGETGDLTVEIEVDSKKKTLTVKDRGIGMTADEVEKYINQIAFSGATDFLDKQGGDFLQVVQRRARHTLELRRQPRIHYGGGQKAHRARH